jgi:putative dehydrogenase
MAMNVGIIGLGIMGSAFAKNLIEAGLNVTGYDIVADNVEALAAFGGTGAKSPKAAVDDAEVVITSLPSEAAFNQVVHGANSLLSANKDDLIVIETSTLPIEAKTEAYDTLARGGTILLDCPISGTGAQAVNRDLAVYGSGDEDAFNACAPVFEGIARSSYYVGEFGNGSRMKYVANLLVHIHNVASAEALVLGMKAGLDPQMIYNVIKDGAGNSRIFELRGPMMVADNYDEATMKMDVWQKDIGVIAEFASELDCPTPLFSTSTDFYRAAMSQGLGKMDTAAVCRILEQFANHKR